MAIPALVLTITSAPIPPGGGPALTPGPFAVQPTSAPAPPVCASSVVDSSVCELQPPPSP
jgi:hypothetical protein